MENKVLVSEKLLKEIIEYLSLGEEKWNGYSQSEELRLIEEIEKHINKNIEQVDCNCDTNCGCRD